MGDAVDGLEQLYNAATGRQVDPVLAVLSAAGLALDLGTGGVGDVTTGVKAAYRVSLSISRQGGGLVALVIREQFVQFTRGRLSPQALVDGLRQRFGRMVDLARARGCGGFSLNNVCLKLYDQLGLIVKNQRGIDGIAALSRLDTLYIDNVNYVSIRASFRERLENINISEISCPVGRFASQSAIEALAIFCPRNVVVDQLDRPELVSATLDNSYVGTRANQTTQRWVRGGIDPVTGVRYPGIGLPTDEAGHILARQLGGPGGILSYNIVPLARAANREMEAIENFLKSQLGRSPQPVITVQISLQYLDTQYPRRPTNILYSYTINGVRTTKVISNPR
ncbi:MAG: hypothetical protein KatS3mg070_2098 [Meiothermus sp.]|uniref:DNA/RNA non-specific endonuclease n=1 Tax=Meiothermus sp. TaxID=1955249 RepID=UPI0021DC30FF|nr:DNA/RNA non-specific endonuclease [Meiothermus sp.]GIW28735.1 MAG: hypothetical protein KatS3mg070_2098 [Meiothermus sp.]